MTWLPTDHRLVVHYVDGHGDIDPTRPMTDIDAVRVALDGAYTLVRDRPYGRLAIVHGLRVAPLASKVTMQLASGIPIGAPRLGFRQGDMTWARHKLAEPLPSTTGRALLRSAHPGEWLEKNWPAIAVALTHDHALSRSLPDSADPASTRWSITSLPSGQVPNLSYSSPVPNALARRCGDLTWVLDFVNPRCVDESEAFADVAVPIESPRRRVHEAPWWDLGAWLFGGSIPRL